MSRPTAEDDLDLWEEVWGGAIALGHAGSSDRELDEAEWETFKTEQAAALARKRPPGFAPWPE